MAELEDFDRRVSDLHQTQVVYDPSRDLEFGSVQIIGGANPSVDVVVHRPLPTLTSLSIAVI